MNLVPFDQLLPVYPTSDTISSSEIDVQPDLQQNEHELTTKSAITNMQAQNVSESEHNLTRQLALEHPSKDSFQVSQKEELFALKSGKQISEGKNLDNEKVLKKTLELTSSERE